jgi:hypothetical protein
MDFVNFSFIAKAVLISYSNPPSEQPFVPVELDYLFENVPDASNSVKYDLQFPDGGSMNNPDNDAVGFILIDGDSQAVSSVSKRDGSHLEFLDCDSITGEHRQTVRYICTDDGPESNCDAMLQGGIAGTSKLESDSHRPERISQVDD